LKLKISNPLDADTLCLDLPAFEHSPPGTWRRHLEL